MGTEAVERLDSFVGALRSNFQMSANAPIVTDLSGRNRTLPDRNRSFACGRGGAILRKCLDRAPAWASCPMTFTFRSSLCPVAVGLQDAVDDHMDESRPLDCVTGHHVDQADVRPGRDVALAQDDPAQIVLSDLSDRPVGVRDVRTACRLLTLRTA